MKRLGILPFSSFSNALLVLCLFLCLCWVDASHEPTDNTSSSGSTVFDKNSSSSSGIGSSSDGDDFDNHQDFENDCDTSTGLRQDGSICIQYRPKTSAIVGITIGAIVWMCGTCCISVLIGLRVVPSANDGRTIDTRVEGDDDDDDTIASGTEPDIEKQQQQQQQQRQQQAHDEEDPPTQEFDSVSGSSSSSSTSSSSKLSKANQQQRQDQDAPVTAVNP